MSLQPVYFDKVVSGDKTVEFRKSKPLKVFETIYFYKVGSKGSIVAKTNVVQTYLITPTIAWEKFSEVCGVSHNEYKKYSDNLEKIFCIQISNASITSFNLADLKIRTAPQNFIYLNI